MVSKSYLLRKKLCFTKKQEVKLVMSCIKTVNDFDARCIALLHCLVHDIKSFVVVQKRQKWTVYIKGQVCSKYASIGEVISSIFHNREVLEEEKKYLSLVKQHWQQVCQELPMSAWPIVVSKMYDHGI